MFSRGATQLGFVERGLVVDMDQAIIDLSSQPFSSRECTVQTKMSPNGVLGVVSQALPLQHVPSELR